MRVEAATLEAGAPAPWLVAVVSIAARIRLALVSFPYSCVVLMSL